jgi:hypothetical protein
MSYSSTEPATISSTDTYSSNPVINEGLTDTQVRIFCALFVLFACVALIIGGKTLHLISKLNYNNNRPICPSVSSLLVASLVMGVFVELAKLLIHITPDVSSKKINSRSHIYFEFSDVRAVVQSATVLQRCGYYRRDLVACPDRVGRARKDAVQ